MPTPKPHTAAVPANDTAVIRLRAVSRTLLADLQTPVGIYLKVRDIFPESALLESSDYHSSENSFSHIGIEPIARFVVAGDTVTEQYPDRTVRTYPLTDDISLPDALNAFVRRFAVESDRPTTNGLFGYTSYDAVRHFEQVRIESRPTPEAEVPEMVYLLYRFVISVNHLRNEMTITENLAEGETSRMDTLLGILASFSAVLTLPGIAGIVLTLGTAVDANVLIYERIREEVRAGKNQKRAVKDGFSNAISAIIDSNVTTVMSGIILMILGTGPIKGFATTLVIGTITSFVSAVFLTRSMLTWYVNRESAKELSFTTNLMKNWLQNTHFDFMGKRKVGYIVSGVMIVICLVSFAVRGLSLGIDFSGGRNYVVRFDQPVQTEEVRELLEDAFEGAAAQVITIGSDNQVRISTKYRIDDNSETVDTEIEGILYENLKSLLPTDVTREAFIQDYVQSSQKVGPTIADDIKRSAIFAIVFAVILIGLYIFARFRSFGYSIGAVIGLSCDALVTIGLYSLFYNVLPFSLEVDQSFIAAVLTIVGYTVNDKVVIFDRIRENVRLYPSRDKGQVINDAINATLSRTFSTAMSTLVVLIAIFIFGGETIRGFVFAILFGVIMGTYSSIFIASPVVYEYFLRKQKKDEAKALAAKK